MVQPVRIEIELTPAQAMMNAIVNTNLFTLPAGISMTDLRNVSINPITSGSTAGNIKMGLVAIPSVK